jgi:hypothetical protein
MAKAEMLPSLLPSLPSSLTEYKIRWLGLSAKAVGDAISAANEMEVHVPVLASKKQEYIPFPGALVRVPRKIKERDGEAHAFFICEAALSAAAPVKKHRLSIVLPPRDGIDSRETRSSNAVA